VTSWYPGVPPSPPAAPDRGRPLLAAVLGGVVGAEALLALLPGGWGVASSLVLGALAWVGVIVCFPLARRHPTARVVGTALALSMAVGLVVVLVVTVAAGLVRA
jgi:hypothetical protein